MNKTARGVIFWTFIIFFLIAAPISVLYTAGFRYNAKNGSFVRTGVISVTSTPRNANIILNGDPVERTTPFVLKRILPGMYELALERTGYHNWSGMIEVTSGQTTELQSILLFQDSEPEQQFIRNIEEIVPSPNGNQAVYLIREGGWEEIWLYDTSTEGPKLIDRLSAGPLQSSVELVWSADGSRILAKNVGTGIVRIYTNTGESVPLEETLVAGFTDIFWHPSSGQIVYVATERELRQFDFDTANVQTFDDDDAASVLIDASVLTFFDNGTQIELRQTIGEDKELIALLPRAQYTIEERDASLMVLTDTRGTLFLIDIRSDQPILLQTNAEVFDWHEGNDQLLFSDGNEVNIYTPSSHSTEFVTRQSEFIESIGWHPSGQAIIVGTATTMSAIEAYPIAEQRFITTLTQVQNIQKLWTTEDGKSAFFYGTVEGATGVYSLTLTR